MDFDKRKIIVKPITSEYFQKNLELLNNIIEESHFLARRNRVSYQENKEFLESVLENPRTIYQIALYSQDLVGTIFALPRLEDLLIHTANIGYFVHRSYRGINIGSILMESLIIESKKRGIKILVAEVAEDNRVSLTLLKKYHFKEFGRLQQGMMKKNKQMIDLLYLSKHLN